MNGFEDVHRGQVLGSLAMFDWLIFKGHLNRLFGEGALRAFLWGQGTPLTDFAAYVKAATQALSDHAERMAADAGRPSIYLATGEHIRAAGRRGSQVSCSR